MTNKTKTEMLKMLDVMTDPEESYSARLEAYEYLSEDCEEAVDDMLARFYTAEGDTAKMLIEVLSRYKGNKAVYLGLVSCLYKGDDVALFAGLLGSYGDPSAIDILKSFAREYELDYNEFMEVRNAVEQLGGDMDESRDFSDDPFFRYLKGLDEPEEDSRRSPFEELWEKRDGSSCGCGGEHRGDRHCDCGGHGECGCGDRE